MTLTAYPGLLSGYGAPYLHTSPLMTTGKIFYVDSATGKANNTGDDSQRPLATLAQALAKTRANKGDMVVCLPGHAETTTAIAWSTAGTRIVGLGVGRNRPTFTATTATSDLINCTAANCHLENVRLAGAASGVTALLDLSSAADDFMAVGVEFAMAATPLEGVTVSSDRWQMVDCTWLGTANGPDRCISIEAKSDNWRVIRPRALFQSGLDNEFIKSVKVCVGYLIEGAMLVGLDTLVVNFSSSSGGPPDGLFASGYVMYSAPVASIEDGVAAATSLGMAFGLLLAVDATGKAAGKIPLATAS